MGRDFYDNFSRAREVYQEADEILGESFSDLIFNGDAETLALTRNSQLSIFITSVAIFEVVKEQMPGIEFIFMGGLSLGELTALYASGRISFANALRLVAKRGQLMHEASLHNKGTMAAVMGMDETSVAPHLCEGVWIANLNCPGQVVISGTVSGVEEVSKRLKEAGAKRVIPLDVSGAFHSGLMEMARANFAPVVEEAPFEASAIQMVQNAVGDFENDLEKMRANVIAQVVAPVRWESCVRAMMREGVTRFIEMGPGKTLNGMNRKIGAGETISIEKVEHLDSMLDEVVK